MSNPDTDAVQKYSRAKGLYDEFEREHGLEFIGPTTEQIAAACQDIALSESLQLFYEVEAWCRGRQDARNIATTLFQQGLIERARGRVPDAVRHFQAASQEFQTVRFTKPQTLLNLSTCRFYLGQELLKLGDARKAREELAAARTIDAVLQNSDRVSAIEALLAKCPPPGEEGEGELGPSAADDLPTTVDAETNAMSPSWHAPLVGPAVIWILTDSAEMSAMMESVKAVCRSVPVEPFVSCHSMEGGAPTVQEFRLPSPKSRPCAVLVSLTRESLAQQSTRDFLDWGVRQVMRHADFRLLVTLKGFSLASLGEIAADEGGDTLRNLLDVVQLMEQSHRGALENNLRNHLLGLQEIRDDAAWNRIRLFTQRLLGWVGDSLFWAALIPAVWLALWLPCWQPGATLRQFEGYEKEASALCGVAAFPFLMLGVYAYSRYLQIHRRGRGHFYVLWGAGFTFVGAPLCAVSVRLHAVWSGLILGLLAGYLLDSWRRAAVRAKREALALDETTVTARHGRVPKPLAQAVEVPFVNPWRCPLLPPSQVHAFISYSRASAWGRRVALDLCFALRKTGVIVFLDQHDIPVGGSWRNELNRHLKKCSLFISVADAVTVVRNWPAAEVETALASRTLTSLPDILVLRKQDLPNTSADTWRWLPAFRTILQNTDLVLLHGESGVRIIDYEESVPAALAASLSVGVHQSSAIVPPRLARFLSRHLVLPRAGLVLLSAFSEYVSLLAIPLWMWDVWSGTVHTWCVRTSLFAPVILLGAFWAGNLSRLAFASRFHARSQSVRRVVGMKATQALGLALLVFQLLVSGESTFVLAVWTFLAAVLGWRITDGFLQREADSNPTFLRRSTQ